MTKELIEFVAPWLVDNPEDVRVEEVEGEGNSSVLEVTVHPDDMGKMIGRQGRIIRSLRTLAKAAGQRQGRSISVEVID